MKEIGKLIELLNEYKETRVKEYWLEFNIWEEKGELHIIIDDGQDNYSGGTCDTDIAISYIISKKFGFIKRLVDNDKINEEEYQFIGTDDMKYTYSDYECLLMLLSIQDEPIQFLISILKDSNNTTKGEVKIGSENQDTQKLDITTTHIEGDTYLA